jgi:hypothetical protein
MNDYSGQDGCQLDPDPAAEQLRVPDRQHPFLVLRQALRYSPYLLLFLAFVERERGGGFHSRQEIDKRNLCR